MPLKVKPRPKIKTPSVRLRAVLYLLWEQEDQRSDPEEFYKIKMEMIINHFKNKLKAPYGK